MSDLTNQILNDVIYSKIPLSQILLKTQILSKIIKNNKLYNWTTQELSGYSDMSLDEISDYRYIYVSVLNNFNKAIYPTKKIQTALNIDVKSLEQYTPKDKIQMTFSSTNYRHLYCIVPYSDISKTLSNIKKKLVDLLLEITNNIHIGSNSNTRQNIIINHGNNSIFNTGDNSNINDVK